MGFLKTKIHISWLLSAMFAGLLVGLIIVKVCGVTVDPPVVALTTVILVASLISKRRLMVLFMIITGVIIGLARGRAVENELNQYDQFVGDEVVIEGELIEDAKLDGGKLVGELKYVAVVLNKQALDSVGKVWFSVDGIDRAPKRHNQIVIQGLMDNGFGNYAATIQSGKVIAVDSCNRTQIDEARDAFNDALSRVVEPDKLGLAMGILTGQQTNISTAMENVFAAASLTHILVASGYNLTVLVRFVRRLLAKRSRIVALILSSTAVILFAMVTGSSASMDRALIVSLTSLALWYVGRKIHPVVMLLAIAALTAMLDPTMIWGDLGWYLSFASFAGVIIVAPLLADLLGGLNRPIDDDGQSVGYRIKSIVNSVKQVAVETISVQLTTTPLILLFIGSTSFTGLITNIIVLPILPLTMLTTFVAGLSSIVLPIPVASIVAAPSNLLLGIVSGVASWGSNLPGNSVECQPTLIVVVGYYIVLLVAMVIIKLWTGHDYRGDNVIE